MLMVTVKFVATSFQVLIKTTDRAILYCAWRGIKIYVRSYCLLKISDFSRRSCQGSLLCEVDTKHYRCMMEFALRCIAFLPSASDAVASFWCRRYLGS